MASICHTKIRYTCLLIHLVSGDLVSIIEEGGKSSVRYSHGVVDLVQSCVAILVLRDSNRFKISMAITITLGRWSLGARTRKLPDCHQQRQTGSVME
jgi:hypothetical protein